MVNSDRILRVRGGEGFQTDADGVQMSRSTGTTTSKSNATLRTRETMKRFFAAVMTVAFFAAGIASVSEAATCPDDVAAAKAALSKKMSEVQAPKSLAGARSVEQAPRGQETQAPRSLAGARSIEQAPRGQET